MTITRCCRNTADPSTNFACCSTRRVEARDHYRFFASMEHPTRACALLRVTFTTGGDTTAPGSLRDDHRVTPANATVT